MSEHPFGPSAHVYDVVYSHLDYPKSAALVEALIKERNPAARSLLDMSCGTGLHLLEWRRSFDEVAGADIDPAMLEVARNRLGEVPLHVADFTDFDLGRGFDAVTCMFSAIGYADSPDRLDAAISAMARHLTPEGVLIVEPWLQPAMIKPPALRTLVVETDEVVVMRSTRHDYIGDEAGGRSEMEFAYVVTTHDGSEFFTEQHSMGVYTPDRYVEAFTRAGLAAEFLTGRTDLGRGLVVGVAAGGS